METLETTAATVAETLPEVTESIAETVAETIAETAPAVTETVIETVPEVVETISETFAATDPIVIIEEAEVVETYDYASALVQIEENTALTAEASGMIAGFSLFNVVVILCFFAYRFFRIFF